MDIEIGSSLCSYKIDYSNNKMIRIAVKHLIDSIMVQLETMIRSLQWHRHISIVRIVALSCGKAYEDLNDKLIDKYQRKYKNT